jgi:hypothetical protein
MNQYIMKNTDKEKKRHSLDKNIFVWNNIIMQQDKLEAGKLSFLSHSKAHRFLLFWRRSGGVQPFWVPLEGNKNA